MVTKSGVRARNGDGDRGKLVSVPLNCKERFGMKFRLKSTQYSPFNNYLFQDCIYPRNLSTRQKVLENTTNMPIFLDLESTNSENYSR